MEEVGINSTKFKYLCLGSHSLRFSELRAVELFVCLTLSTGKSLLVMRMSSRDTKIDYLVLVLLYVGESEYEYRRDLSAPIYMLNS